MFNKKLSLLIIFLLLLSAGCNPQNNQQEHKYEKFSETYFDAFDTLVQIIGYSTSEEEFDQNAGLIHSRLYHLHKLFDIYNNYEGINNVKTINDNAGIRPVKVDRELIDLILFSKEWYLKSQGKINIAFGPVLKIWHKYRIEGIDFPQEAELPPMPRLLSASEHTDINKVIVNTAESTVYLAESQMSLDVGAVAKGFAVELAAKEMIDDGVAGYIINAGGNIRLLGSPLDGIREDWGVGIQSPDAELFSDDVLDTVFVSNASVVSSGDYQRFYIVDGELLHHIIDTETLMPGNYYRAVTVITEDCGIADFMSTALFLIPFPESRELAEQMQIDAVWVFRDGKIEVTEGLKNKLKSFGATNEKE